MIRRTVIAGFAAFLFVSASSAFAQIGQEVSVPVHLQDGQEYTVGTTALLAHGKKLFSAVWTPQEGGLRPLTKGTGAPVTDPSSPLVFPRMFNRISALDANSCAGCHNLPFGTAGGGGDFVAGVFVLGQRFDFATFDGNDAMPLRGTVQENGTPTTMQTMGNYRASLGMLGAGYIELLAREMTGALLEIRNLMPLGATAQLVAKGVSFGSLTRNADGTWNTSAVEGLPAASIATIGQTPPNLIIRPFHQAGNVISIRQFSNNAFNHHHGIQSTERFGVGLDPDGDTFANEMTRADVTAVALFQATLAVPGRVIPNDDAIEAAILVGEAKFAQIGCATCHKPTLPLSNPVFVEPNPFNPTGNLQPGQAPNLAINLNTAPGLPLPRLKKGAGNVTHVPAFTDLKLHDICSGPGDPNGEPLNMNAPAGSPAFFAGNRKFITKKLWGCANEPPFFHHGQFATMRQAILAHAGEALASRQAFEALTDAERNGVIEFLKSLQGHPPGTNYLITDEHGHSKTWPPP